MTTVSVKNLVPRKLAENAQTTQYTANNCKAIVDSFTATNISSANAAFSANLPASGDIPSNANLVIDTRDIAPNETYLCPEMIGQVLEVGGFISTLASVSSAICISVNGREIT